MTLTPIQTAAAQYYRLHFNIEHPLKFVLGLILYLHYLNHLWIVKLKPTRSNLDYYSITPRLHFTTTWQNVYLESLLIFQPITLSFTLLSPGWLLEATMNGLISLLRTFYLSFHGPKIESVASSKCNNWDCNDCIRVASPHWKHIDGCKVVQRELDHELLVIVF